PAKSEFIFERTLSTPTAVRGSWRFSLPDAEAPTSDVGALPPTPTNMGMRGRVGPRAALRGTARRVSNQAKATLVVGASGSQPRVGWLVIELTSLMEICRPRVLAPLISTSAGWHVC